MPKTITKLSRKQEAFIEAYLLTWNATEAARRAGYKGSDGTLGQVGYENLRKPIVKEEIEERMKQILPEKEEGDVRRAVEGFLANGVKISRGKLQKSGIVYLIQEEHGAVKIGKTINLRRRLATLGAIIPYEIKVLMTIKCDNIHTVESELHQRYASKRIKGEWFALLNKDIEQIRQQYDCQINF